MRGSLRVETGLFGYATGRPTLGEDGRYQLDRSRVAFERSVDYDEIDLDSGFLMLPATLPERTVEPDAATKQDDARTKTTGHVGGGFGVREDRATYGRSTSRPAAAGKRGIALSFTADRDALFHSWNALANLADLVGKVSIEVTATSESELDRGKLENGVLEPLRELGLIDDDNG